MSLALMAVWSVLLVVTSDQSLPRVILTILDMGAILFAVLKTNDRLMFACQYLMLLAITVGQWSRRVVRRLKTARQPLSVKRSVAGFCQSLPSIIGQVSVANQDIVSRLTIISIACHLTLNSYLVSYCTLNRLPGYERVVFGFVWAIQLFSILLLFWPPIRINRNLIRPLKVLHTVRSRRRPLPLGYRWALVTHCELAYCERKPGLTVGLVGRISHMFLFQVRLNQK